MTLKLKLVKIVIVRKTSDGIDEVDWALVQECAEEICLISEQNKSDARLKKKLFRRKKGSGLEIKQQTRCEKGGRSCNATFLGSLDS